MSDLLDSATAVRGRAYAPFSGYQVGAAVLDDRGQIHAGCNVENVSFGLTLCAERSAVARMVAEGGRWVREVAVVTSDGGAPCGACLQVLFEFAENPDLIQVHLVSEKASPRTLTLRDLLPHGFTSQAVDRTKRS